MPRKTSPNRPVLVLKSQVRASRYAQAVYKFALLDLHRKLLAAHQESAAQIAKEEADRIPVSLLLP